MDRNTVTGFILIFFLFLGWMYFTMPDPQELEQQRAQREAEDTLRNQEEDVSEEEPFDYDESAPLAAQPATDFGIFQTDVTDTTDFVVETPLYRGNFTNKGGGPSRISLKKHKTWNQEPVQLIRDTTRSAYSLEFVSTENYNIETDQLMFRRLTPGDRLEVAEGETASLQYALELEDGSQLIYTYVFSGDTYEYQLDLEFRGVEEYISGRNYELAYKPGLNFTEEAREGEAQYASAYTYSGGVLEDYQPSDEGSTSTSITGNVDWVSSKTKFFTQIIKPKQPTEAAFLIGMPTEEDDVRLHTFATGIESRLSGDHAEVGYRLYMGPLQYDQLRKFDEAAYNMVDTGFGFLSWFSDPFVKYVVLWFFNFFGGIVGNIGVVIILFAFAVKLVLYPLTKKSFESMAAMKELQPEMKTIQEKYKDDPQKQQQATMKLFKTAKVNPLGSCLPNLLQMPILITFWRFFQNSIEIRQESFLWAADLSSPDVILNLPFTIPFLGDALAGFVILMSISMMVQMQVSGQSSATGNPSMKMLQYVLPFMMLFIFNSLSAGLSLYYLVYNTLSIGQQMLINKQIDHVKMMGSVDKKKAKEMKRDKLLENKKKKKEQQNKA
ncbi:MAG: membrane protein insertase YidC [Balneolales bacterium]